MKSLFVDRSSSLPPWVQIKEQLKIAYTVGRLHGGDVLPSIRALAKQLGVGEAVVRRAYRELTHLGFLSSKSRSHVMVTDHLVKSPHVEKVTSEATAECDRMVEWAKSKKVSSIGLARLLVRRAIAQEMRTPSYLYVDLSASSAKEHAAVIEHAWEIKIAGRGFDDAALLSQEELGRYSAILVNSYRYERLLKIVEGTGAKDRIYPIRLKMSERVVRKIRRLPADSSVLLVLPDADRERIGRAVVDYLQGEVGDKVNLEPKSIGEIPDLAELAVTEKYRLLIVSVHLWEELPEKARRLASVIPTETQIDMESLETVRVQADVLL